MADPVSPPKLAPTPAPVDRLAGLLELMRQATPEQKGLIRDALGVSGIKKKKRRGGTNADAKQFVGRFGECIQGADFQVAPPQAVYEKGPAAVRAWMEKREEGLSITESELDSIVAAAVV